MPAVVAGARAVVVPSLYEGFGLPALEAMAANVPLVAAATSSLPEVVGDGGILVPPSAPAIVEGLLAATAGGGDVARMVAAGRRRSARFTWSASAEAHARVWSSLA
jgi:glycosyltransferase involved in cell wall biosynthesis